MAYNQNIPAASDRLSVSQADLQGNFQALKTLIDVNHGTFGASDEGKHKFLQLPEQGSAPTVAANEAGLYSAVGADSAVTELVFRRESNGTAIPFTEGSLGATQSTGWCREPSGLIKKWGYVTGAASFAIDLTATGPTLSALYNVQFTPTSSVTAYVSASSATALTLNLSSSGNGYWMVLGKE